MKKLLLITMIAMLFTSCAVKKAVQYTASTQMLVELLDDCEKKVKNAKTCDDLQQALNDLQLERGKLLLRDDYDPYSVTEEEGKVLVDQLDRIMDRVENKGEKWSCKTTEYSPEFMLVKDLLDEYENNVNKAVDCADLQWITDNYLFHEGVILPITSRKSYTGEADILNDQSRRIEKKVEELKEKWNCEIEYHTYEYLNYIDYLDKMDQSIGEAQSCEELQAESDRFMSMDDHDFYVHGAHMSSEETDAVYDYLAQIADRFLQREEQLGCQRLKHSRQYQDMKTVFDATEEAINAASSCDFLFDALNRLFIEYSYLQGDKYDENNLLTKQEDVELAEQMDRIMDVFKSLSAEWNCEYNLIIWELLDESEKEIDQAVDRASLQQVADKILCTVRLEPITYSMKNKTLRDNLVNRLQQCIEKQFALQEQLGCEIYTRTEEYTYLKTFALIFEKNIREVNSCEELQNAFDRYQYFGPNIDFYVSGFNGRLITPAEEEDLNDYLDQLQKLLDSKVEQFGCESKE